MKYLLSICLLMLAATSFGQWKEFKISPKGDTLNRVDMKGKKQGPWSVHIDELRGERGYEEEGYYENDLKVDTWRKYSLEGVKIAEENYSWGKLNGKQLYYTYNGGLMREENWRVMDPKVAFDTVNVYDLKDMSKIVNRVVVKNDGSAFKHGRFIYYNPREGTIEATENYVMGKLRTEEDDFVADEEARPATIGKAKSDTAAQKAKPQVVLDYEKKNSGKKKIKTRDGATGM